MRFRVSIVLVSAMLMACAQVQSKATTFKVENIGDGIYVHHGEHLDIDTGYQGDICNISFIVGSLGVAVVDTGGSLKVGNQLKSAIAGVTDKPILYVINTHIHPDHIYGNAAFSPNPKTIFVGHVKLPDAMTLREEAYNKLNVQLLGDDAKGTVIVKPTILVSEPMTLDLGDRQLRLTPYTNAHTNTDISVIDSKTQTLFTGDLLFIERTPVLEGDIKNFIATIDTLKSYPVKQVVPGHGPVAKDCQQALDNEKRYFNAVLTDIRQIISHDGSMREAMDKAAESEKDHWLLFDIANRRNINTVYPALEWE